MLWGCRSAEVKDDSKLERRRWTEDRLLSFSGEGRNPWALLPFFFSSITLFLPSSFLPPPLPSLTPAVSPSLPPSLSETTSKWSPLANQPAAKICTTAFLFSLLACVCNLSSVRARVSELNILSWPHTEQHTRTHSHTNSDQASSRVVFKNPLHSPWGTEALCTRRCCVCVECIHKLASLPLFQLYLQCFRRAVVFLPCTGIFCEEVYGNATSQQHSHCLIIQPLSDFNR